ncbi:MAG TPA: oxygenase MpaB family protein [Nocardioidaceae bacterium]|nr:oxygenase MpaB family protein [Nocardioidaceae bacterium]
MAKKLQKAELEPMKDYGFFGPGSMTWKVWGYPTTPLIGLQRAVVVEELDPALIAAVDRTGANYDRPRTRYDRTVRYFAMVAVADSRKVTQAADVLVKVHSKAIGIEPVSGNRYDANDPHSQLWILLTGWHSVLKAYEVYGPGKLTAEEEAQYWAECAIAAEFQTCSPDDVPRTSEGVREYFESMRPHLAVSEAAIAMMDHLLDAKVVLPPVPFVLRPAVSVASAVLRAGTIATMPRWMRRLSGFEQSRVVDAAVRPVLRLSFAVMARSPRLQLEMLKVIAPAAVPIAGPYLFGIEPLSTEVLTPAEARERYGVERPAVAHLALRARQHERVFGQQVAPSDEGLIESEAMLGSIA